MMIGTSLSARSRLQTSRPSSFGSIRSRTTRSTCSDWKSLSASSPSRACRTRKPSRSRGYARSFWIESSSSTRRMVEESGMSARRRLPAGHQFARRYGAYYSPVWPPFRPGPSVVMAHRDNDGTGPGANDNASGTAMLIQLARAYGSPPGVSSGRLHPNHTILFLSTDGGAFGGLGAAWFAAHSPGRHDVAAVINLDAVGGKGPVRLQFNGDTPRTASGTLVETAAARVEGQIGRRPARASALAQLVDLGFPFSLYEQAPFLAKGIAAVTITTAGDRPPNPLTDTLDGLSASRLGEVGRAAQDAIGTLDEGLEFAQGTSSYVYVGSRLVRGWAVELVLIACLLPFMATAIDLFARCRRRRIPLAPALRAYRSRLGFWAWTLGLF